MGMEVCADSTNWEWILVQIDMSVGIWLGSPPAIKLANGKPWRKHGDFTRKNIGSKVPPECGDLLFMGYNNII